MFDEPLGVFQPTLFCARIISDSCVHRHDEMENILHRLQQMLSVIDLDIELAFDGIVDQNASLDVHVVVFVIPVRLESDWDTIPSVWIDVAETIAANLDDALGHDMRLLVQVNVVLIRVVEGTHGTDRG